MIGLIANAVLHPNIVAHIKQFMKDKLALLFTAIFVISMLSYFQSTDVGFWAERVRIKLPFLILPFAISSLFPLEKKLFHQLIFIFWLSIVLFVFYSSIHFIFNYQSILQSYAAAQTLWTPVDHIRFSLAVACSIWLGIYLYRVDFYIKYLFEKNVYFFVSILLVIYLHILAVRSGLLGFYLSVLYFIFYFLWIKKQWKHALATTLIALVVCGLAIICSPTIATKIGYMKYDINEYLHHKNVQGKSDAGRLMSQEMAIQVIIKNKLLGVGLGDVERGIKNEYAQQHPEIIDAERLMPHNQFLFNTIAFGMIISALIGCLFLIFFGWNKNYQKWPLSCVYIVLISSFMTESTLEIQIGTTLFLFLTLMLHYQFKPLTEI
jgi:O-antigen ligase